MSLSFADFAYLLLFLPFTQAALTVTVPEGPIQAKPNSDVLLPCYFEHSSGYIDPKRLAVKWRVGSRVIAAFEDDLKVFRPGAKMSPEALLRGNASLLLPSVQDADSSTYTCFVIHSPDNEQKSIELRVEAPPLVKLGSTTVQLEEPSTVVCTATDFYPGNISITWFRNERIIQRPESPPVQPSTSQLFRAESVLKLTPDFSDANVSFSCHIDHQALKVAKVIIFQLHLQARPVLRVITKPPRERFEVAVCTLSKFYPSRINVQWLQDGVPQDQVKSEVNHMNNGMFSIHSVLFPQKSDVEVTYVCRAEHEALETPLKESVLWQPGEGDEIVHASLPVTKSTRYTFSLSPSRPTVAPTIPLTSVTPWPGIAIGFVSAFILGVGIGYCISKAKNKRVTNSFNEKSTLQKSEEEQALDRYSKSKTEETRSELIRTDDSTDVEGSAL
ncbi:CD276 antigen homolog isoform X1 [Erythrolamprus reginae]|uniref:CD276 antigen homolog isoform X1 n=1 Tax=Erythrolamprus reginae TaxID=121349 RepID=UPI00396CF16C